MTIYCTKSTAWRRFTHPIMEEDQIRYDAKQDNHPLHDFPTEVVDILLDYREEPFEHDLKAPVAASSRSM